MGCNESSISAIEHHREAKVNIHEIIKQVFKNDDRQKSE